MEESSRRSRLVWAASGVAVLLTALIFWAVTRDSSGDDGDSGEAGTTVVVSGDDGDLESDEAADATAGADESDDVGTDDTEPTVDATGDPVDTAATDDGDDSAGATTVPVTTLPADVVTTTTEVPATEIQPRTTAEGTEEDPVPVGEVIEFPRVWDIVVTAVDVDAADTVAEYADINPLPEDGQNYVLISLAGTYLGDQVAEPAFEWAIESGDNSYLPSIPGCGVIDDSLYDLTEVRPGGSFVGQLCMPMAAVDIPDAVVFFQIPGDEPIYFELES